MGGGPPSTEGIVGRAGREPVLGLASMPRILTAVPESVVRGRRGLGQNGEFCASAFMRHLHRAHPAPMPTVRWPSMEVQLDALGPAAAVPHLW